MSVITLDKNVVSFFNARSFRQVFFPLSPNVGRLKKLNDWSVQNSQEKKASEPLKEHDDSWD